MKVENIAECSLWSILQYFWPALSDTQSWKPFFVLFESDCYTQVLLYMYIISGRGNHSHAYTHSVQDGHHVFLNLLTHKFYCLPDNYEIIDSSLDDIIVSKAYLTLKAPITTAVDDKLCDIFPNFGNK